MPSCAAWLSWKCQIAPGTAREQVRVARSLAEYPLIRQELAASRLSYAKARALTRIVTPETEADLVAMATVTATTVTASMVTGSMITLAAGTATFPRKRRVRSRRRQNPHSPRCPSCRSGIRRTRTAATSMTAPPSARPPWR